MNEYDVAIYFDQVLRLTAKRLGIESDFLTTFEIEEAVEKRDQIAFKLLKDFLSSYRQWFDEAKKAEQSDTGTSTSDKKPLLQLMDARDQSRKALVEHLNDASNS